MPLDNSTIQHPLPGDLQARVENALNLVTSLEAEHNRLEKMIGSQKGSINDNHITIKETEKEVASSKKKLTQLNTDIANNEDKLNTLQYAIKDANHELEQVTKQKTEVIAFIEEQKIDLDKRVARVSELENEIDKRLLELHAKEVNHQSKVDKLLEAIK